MDHPARTILFDSGERWCGGLSHTDHARPYSEPNALQPVRRTCSCARSPQPAVTVPSNRTRCAPHGVTSLELRNCQTGSGRHVKRPPGGENFLWPLPPTRTPFRDSPPFLVRLCRHLKLHADLFLFIRREITKFPIVRHEATKGFY